MERKILAAALQSRSAFDSLQGTLEVTTDLSSEGQVIWGEIAKFYELDPKAGSADREIIGNRIQRGTMSNKLADFLVDALKGLPSLASDINVAQEVREMRKANVGGRIASLLASGKHTPDVERLMDEYRSLSSVGALAAVPEEERVFTDTKVEELCAKSFDKSGLIKVLPKSLNDQLDGGVRPGHHILVFAPTEMGKSLFVINMTYGFLVQDLPVLYIGNEDPAADILMRCITRCTGMRKQEVVADPLKAQKLLDRLPYKLLTVAALAPGTFREVRQLCSKFNPKVVILDQLRNMDVQSENRTQALERAATEARNLAKSCNVLVVSVTQAGDSASGKRILNRGDVDGSNVGIPGQADVMLGIGADASQEDQNIRVLSFPKNKVSGNHTPITVSIDPMLSKVIDHV